MTYYKRGAWNAVCSSCLEEKDINSFYLHSNGKPRKQCKSCRNTQNTNWKQNNPDKVKEIQQRAWATNREVMLARTQKWRQENLAYDAFRAQLYRNRKRQAVPPWANLDTIEQIYRNRPEGYHVDHIIPLKGKLVCGLHVETNLQYLPAIDNIRKRNIYDLV